jgi:hypothetical protein
MVNATFLPGPLPKSSRIPASAGYSGLVECPCSDRLEKDWHMSYGLRGSSDTANNNDDECPMQNAAECYLAARDVVQAQRYSVANSSAEANDPALPKGCSVRLQRDGSCDILWNGNDETTTDKMEVERIILNSGAVVGTALGIVNLTVGIDNGDWVHIEMVGPADRWFGVGFGTDTMCLKMAADECPTGGPYTLVVSGETVVERKLDYHGPGTVLVPSIRIESNTVDDTDQVRTVRLSRSAAGVSDKHFTFDAAVSSLPVIVATGCGLDFAQHCGHGSNAVTFLPVGVPRQVCQTGIKGTVGGNPFDNNRCAPNPIGDLADQGNPTCQVQTYAGGLMCCRDNQSLLDTDQENPWPDQYLEYRLKFRFYFEEYTPSSPVDNLPSHRNLIRYYWQTETFAGEYDIPQCADGVPPSQCVHVITSRWKVRDAIAHFCDEAEWCHADDSNTAGIELIYLGPHCHAPTCLSMELYNADTGQLLCHVEPIHGESGTVYDERGFLAIPPCLFGNRSEGLLEPQFLSLNATLLSIKRNNSTLPHTGEMASWQMRAVRVPRDAADADATKEQESRRFGDPESNADRASSALQRPMLRSAASGGGPLH